MTGWQTALVFAACSIAAWVMGRWQARFAKHNLAERPAPWRLDFRDVVRANARMLKAAERDPSDEWTKWHTELPGVPLGGSPILPTPPPKRA